MKYAILLLFICLTSCGHENITINSKPRILNKTVDDGMIIFINNEKKREVHNPPPQSYNSVGRNKSRKSKLN